MRLKLRAGVAFVAVFTEFYFDILVTSDVISSVQNDNSSGYDPYLASLLHSHDDTGWYPAILCGTEFPLSGSRNGSRDGDRYVFEIGGNNLPDSFRIITVCTNGEVKTSNIINRDSNDITVTFNYFTSEFVKSGSSIRGVWQFIVSALLTFGIALLLLKLFGFSVPKNIRPAVLTVLATQIFYFAVAWNYSSGEWTAMTFLIQLGTGFIEIIGAAVAGAFFIKGKTKKHRALYSICTYTLSFLIVASLIYLLNH